MSANPYTQYQRVGVETADRGRLLLMLYEGALRFLRRARKALYDRDLEGANNNLLRAEDIVSELMASLDLENGGEIAGGLFRLYDYMYHLLLEANLKKDPQPLGQVETMLEELRDTWKEALGENGAPGATENAVRAFPGVPPEVQGTEKPLIAEAKESYSGYKKGKQVRKDLQEYLLNIIR
jgi:flagellar protein FliS